LPTNPTNQSSPLALIQTYSQIIPMTLYRPTSPAIEIKNESPPKPWTILLYYKYVQIDLPEKFAYEHLKLCKSLGLKGRILVAQEGINGTVGGPQTICEEYQRIMREDSRFQDMEFKVSEGEPGTFKKIFVRCRPELVTLNYESAIDPTQDTATHLPPAELKKMYDQKEDFVIIDMRNKYEADIGKFKDAVVLDMKVFKELPDILPTLEQYKNKKVVTYCTGGIRCEKASALLKKTGFKNVYQLDGGVAKYGQQFPDDYWEGKLFVFDERMAMPINSPGKEKIIGQCYHCQKPWDDYINCTNAACNKLLLCCPDCRITWNDACSKACSEKPRAKKK
jgi:UPF0176 protein